MWESIDIIIADLFNIVQYYTRQWTIRRRGVVVLNAFHAFSVGISAYNAFPTMRAPMQILVIPYKTTDGIPQYCIFKRSDAHI